ncbi:MAG: serine/threonine-protein kinase, partial [Planctomycetota bacterium]
MDPETIFSEALKKATPTEREEFLAEACGDNSELRAEIDALLAAHNDAGSFLERTPEELDVTTDFADSLAGDDDSWRELLDSSEATDSIGQIAGYEVRDLIGRGGMGVVLRAVDPKLNRIVAIKLLAPAFAANPMSVRRFLREAQAAAAVSHDHAVAIHAIDEEAQPPIIVMEYVPGKSLQQKIDAEGALDLRSILRIGMQTASGLAAAHRQGLVHRDIKPANILLENGIERVKLTDFGLARAVDDIGMTQSGQITGTPQYMSPEQAQGQRIDHRTDLFSLGCVLYAMCTGQAAFRADSAVAVMHRIVHDTPRPIRSINEDIPQWLCDIVDKLLAKNANDRFGSAEEVEDLLSRHLAHLQQPDSAPFPESINAAPGPIESSAVTAQETQQLPKWFFTRIRTWMVVSVIAIATGIRLFVEFGNPEAAMVALVSIATFGLPLLVLILIFRLLRRRPAVADPPRSPHTLFWIILFASAPPLAALVVKQFTTSLGPVSLSAAAVISASIAAWLLYQRSRIEPEYAKQNPNGVVDKRRLHIVGLWAVAILCGLLTVFEWPLRWYQSLDTSPPQQPVRRSERVARPAVESAPELVHADHTLYATPPERPQAPVVAVASRPSEVYQELPWTVTAYNGGPSDGHVIVKMKRYSSPKTFEAPGIRDVSISADDRSLAWVGDGHKVHVERVQTRVPIPDWQVTEGSVLRQVEWAPEGEALLAATDDAAFVWQHKKMSSPEFSIEAGDDATIESIVWRPDGQQVACGTSTGEVVLLTITA